MAQTRRIAHCARVPAQAKDSDRQHEQPRELRGGLKVGACASLCDAGSAAGVTNAAFSLQELPADHSDMVKAFVMNDERNKHDDDSSLMHTLRTRPRIVRPGTPACPRAPVVVTPNDVLAHLRSLARSRAVVTD
jgi:hypothetical protein